MLRIGLFFLIFFGLRSFTFAQNTKAKIPLRLFSFSDSVHSPKKAGIYSAIIPGLGQAYNQKYWKLPIVYVGIGASAYFLLTNRASMRKLNADFRIRYRDMNTNNDPSPEELNKRDQFRRFRDVSIITLSAIYALQIVDATVDAHFYKINLNQNLNALIQVNPSRFITFNYAF